MPRSSSDLNPCPPLAPFLQTRDLSSTLHYRRLISYDDRLVAHTMPMLIKSMTCIFPPFPLLFVFLPYTSFFFFFFPFPSSSYVCAYLSPSIFCPGSSPSAKPISSHTLPYSCLYPIPTQPSTATSLTIKLPASSRTDNSHSDFPILSFPLHPLYLLACVPGYQKQTDIF